MQTLIKRYQLPTGLINYSAFCKNIDEVFDPKTDAQQVLAKGVSTSKYNEHEQGTMT